MIATCCYCFSRIKDGAKFFLDYISSDLLGAIATRHLQIADASPIGSRDPDCLTLAALHSDAVDYAKTGYVPFSYCLTLHHRAFA